MTARATPRSVNSCRKSGRKAARIHRQYRVAARTRKEGLTDEEDDEDGDDASLDPVVDGDEVVASSLSSDKLPVARVLADRKLLVERAEEDEGEHEELDGEDDEDVVDVESRVAVVEGEEAVHGELGAEVVVLAREHLLSHSRPDLRLEVEDGTKSEISTLTALWRGGTSVLREGETDGGPTW